MQSGIGGVHHNQLYQQSQAPTQQQKHDIFVGNLAFNTTEEQLHTAFSEIGRVIKVRMVTDVEGKPRGFAFVEFADPQAALSAIRNMNDYELNGRRLRVNFSNSSHLETLATKLGMDLSRETNQRSSTSSSNNINKNDNSNISGTNTVADSLKAMSKGEMYDVVAKFKEIAEKDPDEARRLLAGHPQLPEAMLFLMSKLDMVTSSQSVKSNDDSTSFVNIPTSSRVATDPRARVPANRTPATVSTPAAVSAPVPPPAIPSTSTVPPKPIPVPPPPPADPRSRMADPRARTMPPPPQHIQQQQQPPPPFSAVPPPPPPPPQPQQTSISNLDPGLVRQVMSLTPEMISQLPPHKQQSILALRQQISGSGM